MMTLKGEIPESELERREISDEPGGVTGEDSNGDKVSGTAVTVQWWHLGELVRQDVEIRIMLGTDAGGAVNL